MITHKCPKAIDKPITIVGLEPIEIVTILFMPVGILFILFPMLPFYMNLLTIIAIDIFYVKAKSGKPPGWIIHQINRFLSWVSSYIPFFKMLTSSGLLRYNLKKFDINPEEPMKKQETIFNDEIL